jgi:protein-disulfide isomerase
MRIRFILSVLLIALISPAVAEPANQQQPLAASETPAEKTIHDYLVAHPEVVVEALRAAKAKAEQADEARAREALETRKAELLHDETSPVGGNPNGDVTIVEFFDYRCHYCKQMQPSLETLLKSDDKVRLVYKEFPILGKASVFAATVALAAEKQGKFDAFHRAMMAASEDIDAAKVIEIARSAGLDLDKIKSDIRAPEIQNVLRHNFDLAKALNISATPGLVIGDDIVSGAPDYETLKNMVAAARNGG